MTQNGSQNASENLKKSIQKRSQQIRRNIIENIEIYEPRAKVIDVKVSLQPDRNSLDVTLKFKVVNTEEEIEFTTTLARLR